MFERGLSMMIAKSNLKEEIKRAFLDRTKMIHSKHGDLLQLFGIFGNDE
jgi:hypothetical protein